MVIRVKRLTQDAQLNPAAQERFQRCLTGQAKGAKEERSFFICRGTQLNPSATETTSV